MQFLRIAVALLALAGSALAQSYPSPTLNNVTIIGSVFLNPNSGFLYSNGPAAATYFTTIPLANLPTGTSGAAIPVLNAANTWAAAQTFSFAVTNSAGETTTSESWSAHIWGSGIAPAVSACGTTPSISTGANDIHGTVTSGTATPTSCTVTWASARTNTPDCAVNSPTGTAVSTFTPGTTSLVITFPATSGAKFTYLCMGQ